MYVLSFVLLNEYKYFFSSLFYFTKRMEVVLRKASESETNKRRWKENMTSSLKFFF